MAWTAKTERPCDDCGEPTNRRHKVNSRPVCLECSIDRMSQGARELRAKEGPTYDAWLAKMRERFGAPA